MAIWWDYIKSLQTHLQSLPAFANVTVLAGATKSVIYPSILLIRDTESGEKIALVGNSGQKGQVSFIAEFWERDDTTDPANGYGKIATVEDLFFTALPAWLKANGSIQEITISGQGDGDAQRPSIASRKTITINWTK